MNDDDQHATDSNGPQAASDGLDFVGEDPDPVNEVLDGSDGASDGSASDTEQVPEDVEQTFADSNADMDAEEDFVDADDDQSAILVGNPGNTSRQLSATHSLPRMPPPTAPGNTLPTQQVSAADDVAAVGEAAVAWASRWDVADDPYISGLVSAIDGRDNLTSWAAMDPHELLPYPESLEGRALRRLTRVILVLRNVTVFIPVALTWLAINMATDAYGPYLDGLEEGETTSFLEFWQSGGDDGSALDSFWRIQHIAFVDALIISGIVLATLLASAFEARSRVRSQAQEATMELERRALALQIMAGLQASKSASPKSITEALALALEDLLQAARDVGVAASRMEVASVGIESLTPRVADLSIHTAELGRSLTNDVNKAINDLGRSVSTLGVTLGGDMQRFLTDVLVGLEEINDRLSRTSVSVEFGTKQLRDDLDAMHGSLSQLTGRQP